MGGTGPRDPVSAGTARLSVSQIPRVNVPLADPKYRMILLDQSSRKNPKKTTASRCTFGIAVRYGIFASALPEPGGVVAFVRPDDIR